MRRMRGGGGGGGGGGAGGGMPRPQKSEAEKDDDYWAKRGMSSDSAADAYKAAVGAQPKQMTWDEALGKAMGK